MKVKVLINFVDLEESKVQEKEVLRTVGDVFTVSQERFKGIKVAGNYVEEVEEVKEVKEVKVESKSKPKR